VAGKEIVEGVQDAKGTEAFDRHPCKVSASRSPAATRRRSAGEPDSGGFRSSWRGITSFACIRPCA
jgi:hypothetical protein